MSNELPSCCHVGFREKQTAKPNTRVLVIRSLNESVELFESPLKINNVVGEVDSGVDDETNPRFGDRISVNIFGQFPENIGGKDFTVTEVLGIKGILLYFGEKFGCDGDLSFQEAEEWVVHFIFGPFQFFDLLWNDFEIL